MRWDSIPNEIHDIAIAAARSRELRTSIHIVDPAPIARAWLQNEDEEWRWQNERHALSPDDMPGARISRGLSAFEDGACTTDTIRKRGTLFLMPPFISPTLSRENSGIASTMPGFGGLGEQRFTALHEMGHWLSEQTGIEPRVMTRPSQRLKAEAYADGFAVAWAVATGSDPEAVWRDVALFRAGGAVMHFAPEYLTFSVLEEAAASGLKQRGPKPDPWSILDDVHGIAARTLPPADFTDGLTSIDGPENLHGSREAEALGVTIRRHLARQKPWTRANEQEWWTNVSLSNSDMAPVFRRMPITEILARICEGEHLERVPEPMDAEIILKRLVPVAALSGADRRREMESLIPAERNRRSFAAAFEGAAKILTDPLDSIAVRCLNQLGEHARNAKEEPGIKLSGDMKGVGGKVAPFVLIDARGEQMDKWRLDSVTDKLAGTGVRAIAVVHDTTTKARDLARTVRLYSDNLSASIHAFDGDLLAEKAGSIVRARKQGAVLAIGRLPEFAAAERQRE